MQCTLTLQHEQDKVVSIYHDDPMAGHNGVDKTVDRIAKRYYWKGLRGTVEAYIKQCIDCQRYKPLNKKPAGLL